MRAERRNLAEQELSIKQREDELYVEEPPSPSDKPPPKPFAVYLREIPANPLDPALKVVLWVVAVAVVLLFLGALWRSQRSSRARARPSPPPPAVIFVLPSPYPGAGEDGRISCLPQ